MSRRSEQTQAELALDARATLGEGPVWQARRRRLYWVDIREGKIHEFDPASGRDCFFEVGQFVGCLALRKQGGLLLGLQHGLAWFNLKTRKASIFRRPDRRLPGNRFNDGKCDPAGRFWAGTMSMTVEPKRGSLFCLAADLSLRRVLEGVTVPNGLAWSPDARTMFFIDSASQSVWAFDYELSTGRLTNRRMVIRIPPRTGVPDGMTVDAEGMLWVAHWGGGQITRWNPATSRLLQTIRLPVSQVTSCAFGGAGLDELFITSARFSMTAQQLKKEPLAGGLFRVRPGVAGLVPHEFIA